MGTYPTDQQPAESITMKLPPFGKQFDPVPRSGVRVAIGPGAWEFAKKHRHPIMVLSDGDAVDNYRWLSNGGPALMHERGDYNDERLDSRARALLKAGASSVVAIREALLDEYDPRVFYDKGIVDVA
jgi:hypothetical protein